MSRAVLVVYDVCDDLRRASVREALRPIADRPQQSGWLVPSTAGLSAGRIAAGLGSLLGVGDRLIAHEPCIECARGALWLPASQHYGFARRHWVAV